MVSSAKSKLKHASDSDKALQAARFYGFRHLSEVSQRRSTSTAAPQVPRTPMLGPNSPLEKIIATCVRKNALPDGHEPLMVYDVVRAGGAAKRSTRLQLAILGVPTSFAEAVLFATSLAILKEIDPTLIHAVRINSLGDQDSFVRFGRECTLFSRKHIGDMLPACRKDIRVTPLHILLCKAPPCISLCAQAPAPIHFLGESAKQHLKEVLEFLEILQVPYAISDHLILDGAHAARIIFEIGHEENAGADRARRTKDSRPFVRGIRFDGLPKQLGVRRTLHALGATICIPAPAPVHRKISTREPSVYFIHIGTEAKHRSLLVFESLRQANINAAQTLYADRLTGQVSYAEENDIPFTLIMGQKEAMSDTVIVRNTLTRSQETVPLGNLTRYLKACV